MTTTWVSGVGTFATQFALAFMSAGIFSYLMRETKCGEAIGQTFIKYVGGDNAPFILAIVAAILQLAGIQTYIFIVAAMAFGLMKAANLPIYIGYAAVVAVPPIVSFTFRVLQRCQTFCQLLSLERQHGQHRAYPLPSLYLVF